MQPEELDTVQVVKLRSMDGEKENKNKKAGRDLSAAMIIIIITIRRMQLIEI